MGVWIERGRSAGQVPEMSSSFALADCCLPLPFALGFQVSCELYIKRTLWPTASPLKWSAEAISLVFRPERGTPGVNAK